MGSSVVVAYLAIVLLLSWILRLVPRPSREGMEQKCKDNSEYGICEQPILGPKQGEQDTYPNLYGPNYKQKRVYDNDNGLFESNTAGDNTFYGNVLTPSSSFISITPANTSNAFQTTGPPQPFLTDFQAFHR